MAKTQEEAEQNLRKMTAEFIEKISPMLFAPISMQQFATTRDTPVRGPMWVSRHLLPKPTDQSELKRVIVKVLGNLASREERIEDFSIEDVKVQWTAYKPCTQEKELEPLMSEEEKYNGMMKDVSTDTTILYAHGGFYYTGSPASVRPITLALARQTGGRCLSVDYRLAPQNPFPAAIVDLFLAYLSILYPSERSIHTAVLAKNIVLAGDSSGGNLVLSLLAFLQHIRDHENGRVNFNGRLVDVPLPAGIATMGAHCDLTSSFDAHTRNKPYDIFYLDLLPYLQPWFQACDLWPTRPPRADIYCDASTLLHPLASVAIAPSWSTKDMPPMFFAYGQEKLVDEGYYLARKAEEAGTKVQFSQYDALPHNFAAFFPKLVQSKHLLQEWGSFCREVAQNPKQVKSKKVRYAANETTFEGAELELPVNLDEQDRRKRMQVQVAKRKTWTGPTERASL